MSLRGQALGLAGLLLIFDQGTKALIRESLALGARLDLTPFFALVHAENRGAAFSFLAGASGWQRWFFLALALGFILIGMAIAVNLAIHWLTRTEQEGRW